MSSQGYQPKVGDKCFWIRRPRGGYGYALRVPAVVVEVRPRRVVVDAELAAGGTRRVRARPGNVVPR